MKENINVSEQECKLNSCLFFTSSKLSRVLKKQADDIFKTTGLSPSHAFILYFVSLKKRVHQKDVGDYLLLTPSTMTRFVEKLEAKKLVIKEVEGKNVYLNITKKGEDLQPAIFDSWKELNDLMNSTLTEEEKMLYLRLTNKMLSNIES